MSRILLADDHPMIRTALEALLRGSDFEIVGTSATGEEALKEYERLQPDLLLLDLQMPGGTGMDVVRALNSAGAEVKIVILTASIDDGSLIEAQALGVSGLVLKSSDPAFLLDCLERVKEGGKWIDPELQSRIDELSGALAASPRPTLAPRERELIRFVSKGLRNREIAAQLGVTEGTVKVYLHAVFEKLGVSSRTELAVRADEFLAWSYLKRS
jgi:two-component system, NarL family, nitrate/nitrite response regulator NarL